ncbi:MAG: polysaccharide deacetylase family protein [Bacilli bacterium]|nr:polysaccharide deacetylase family protein [Bacilli bacterium]
MTKRRKIKKKNVSIGILILLLAVLLIFFLPIENKQVKNKQNKEEIIMSNYVGKDYEELKTWAEKNELTIESESEYSSEYKENIIISQNIEENTKLKKKDKIKVVISKGEIPVSIYKDNNVDELGNVPIMMYHGIHNMKNSETPNTGGNVDVDGYNRTTEAFRKDLEFYYQNNYRMIRLVDYIHGKIDVELGKSPIILTFDDGKENNFKVLGKKDGKLEIDPNCAVGILEEFKNKYKDFNVTATFFVNGGLFQQEEYDTDILNWLVDNGYDVGNHTLTHPDFTKIGAETTQKEVGTMYQKLDNILKDKYVHIIAMPFGSPYRKDHPNFNLMLKGTYEGNSYETESMLRVGWEAELSPFNKEFDKTFLKRIRAYDHNGTECDIEMNFNILKNNRYISDGDPNLVVIKEKDKDNINTDIKVRAY